MIKIKVGDKIKFLINGSTCTNTKIGDIEEVVEIYDENVFHTTGTTSDGRKVKWKFGLEDLNQDFEIVKPKTPHKHVEMIKAWADGEEIQCKSWQGIWFDSDEPTWKEDNEYRIKPEPKPDVETRFSLIWDFNKQTTRLYDTMGTHRNVKAKFDGETGELTSVEISQ